MRKQLSLTDSTMNVVMTMAEGNPGAVTVLCRLLKERPDDGLMLVLHLDDMNIRGSQIWVAWKDHCEQDMERFVAASKAREPEMVGTVNAECHHPEIDDPAYQQVAVTSGASFNRAE